MLVSRDGSHYHISMRVRVGQISDTPSSGLFAFSDPVTLMPMAIVRLSNGEYVALPLAVAARALNPSVREVPHVVQERRQDGEGGTQATQLPQAKEPGPDHREVRQEGS